MYAVQSLHLKDCNFTNFEFMSKYNLGQQDELNRTFSKINQNMSKLGNITRVINTQQYTVEVLVPSFNYIEANQSANIIKKDAIVITGGWVFTTMNFRWNVNTSSINGTGTALCRSNNIVFVKGLTLQLGFLVYFLQDYENVTFTSYLCQINRIDPPPTSQTLNILTTIFNQDEPLSVRTQLSLQLSKLYSPILNTSLYESKHRLKNSQQYTWVDPYHLHPPLLINYTILPTGVDIDQSGISYHFITENEKDANWHCGVPVPSNELDPRLFGGIQEFLSLSVFENSARYAMQKGYLNTVLNQQLWQSNMFQFRAGDLYDIIPKIAELFYASSVVSGACQTNNTQILLSKLDQDKMTTNLAYKCWLQVQDQKISQFALNIFLTIQILPQSNSLMFRIFKIDHNITFSEITPFIINNPTLAQYLLTKSLQLLKSDPIFGTGWSIYQRDDPRVQIKQGYLIIYNKMAD